MCNISPTEEKSPDRVNQVDEVRSKQKLNDCSQLLDLEQLT
ncbi:hypothetical protein [Aerosakkonema funiforme]